MRQRAAPRLFTVQVEQLCYPPVDDLASVSVGNRTVYIIDGARCKSLAPQTKIILCVFDRSKREHKARIVCAVGLDELPE